MKTFGKVAGGLSLLLLFTAPITLFVTSGSYTYAAVKAGIGAALLAFYFVTNKDRFTRTAAPVTPGAMNQGARAGFFLSSTIVMGLVAVALVVGINFIVAKRTHTYDLTNKKIFSLSPQTSSTLKDMKQPVQAIGFLDAKNPSREPLEALFQKYATENEKFTYDFKDPHKSPDLAAKYQIKEGQSTVVLTMGSGPTESHTALNAVSEQELTNALIKMNSTGVQKVYILSGHGEWPLEGNGQPAGPQSPPAISEFKTSLSQEGYAVEPLNLVEKNNQIPADAAMLVIARAATPFSDGERAALETYLDQGGRVLYFAEYKAEPGLDALLAKYGVQVEKGMLADRLNPREPFVLNSPFFGEHEITRILQQTKMQVTLPTVRALTPLKEGLLAGVVTTPLVLSSPLAWVESTPDESAEPSAGERTGAMPMVVAVSRDTKASTNKRFDEARLVVFGDSELLVDANWGHEANRNLVMNAVAWATTQVQKITIRPPDRDISTLDVDEALLTRIRFVSMDVLPVLLIGIGLAIWVSRRNK